MFEASVSRELAASVLVAMALAGCGRASGPGVYAPEHSARYTGAKVEPTSDGERAVLRSLDRLETGKQMSVGGFAVVADTPYFAASGRTCRAVQLKRVGAREGTTRLACKDDASWFFAPSVMGHGGSR